MSLTINTNANSLIAQHNLSTSQSSLSQALQRLSSGLRINSAQDDAAGMAIASRMTTQINGLAQAARNANDGISLAQTTEGALQEVTNNLQRIRELAVQATNATNSASDRAALNQEVQQDLAEIQRLAIQTSFNGQRVLDGSFGQATFQVGANVGDTIGVSLSTSMQTKSIGRTADYVGTGMAYDSTKNLGQQGAGVDPVDALTGTGLQIAIGTGNAVTIGASVAGNTTAGQSATSAWAKAAAITAAGIPGLTATADTTTTIAWTDVTSAAYSLSINGTAIETAYNGSTTTLTGDQAAAAINAKTGVTGVTASFASGVMTLQASDGSDIAVSQTIANGGNTGDGLGAAVGTNNTVNGLLDYTATAATGDNGATPPVLNVSVATTATAVGTIHLNSLDTITLSGSQPDDLGYTATTLALGNSALNSATVASVAGANQTINMVDAALTSVSALQSALGAMQTRFTSVTNSLGSENQSLQAARSRIQDADFAAETANLTRAQILQQAGISVLAQANSAPQAVLKLLQ